MTKEELIKELESLGFRQSSSILHEREKFRPFVYNISEFYDINSNNIGRIFFYLQDGPGYIGYRFLYDIMDQKFNVITGINIENIEIKDMDIPSMITLYK